jgi:dihydrolipoamide dehydrogenase
VSPREANYEAVPRVVYAAGRGGRGGRSPLQRERSGVGGVEDCDLHARLCESNGFLTLLSDGERLTGAYALGPEAGEWLQQATLAIRGRVPLEVLRDTIQPFPTFSEIYVAALKALRGSISAELRVV